MERQVDSIDEKLQLLIEMYQEDRKRLIRLESQVIGDGNGAIQSPTESEINLGSVTPTPSRSSTLTSLSQGLDMSLVCSNLENGTNSVNHKDMNAFNV